MSAPLVVRLAAVLALAAAACVAGPASAAPLLGDGPAAADSGRVIWERRVVFAPRADSLPSDSAAWAEAVRRLEGRGLLAAACARRLAFAQLAVGDSTNADSLLALPSLSYSPWAWSACERRAQLALARGDHARAARLLDAAVREGWPDGERAQWLALRSEVALAVSDSAEAEVLARQLVRVYPSSGAAARGIRLLEALAGAHGDSLAVTDLRLAGESEALRAMRSGAIARFRRVLARSSGADRHRDALRLAEMLLTARMPLAARTAAETARRAADDETGRARARLLQARAMRASSSIDSSLALYADLGAHAPTATIRSLAWWEYAREAQDRSRWAEARRGFVRVAQAGDRRADDARFLAGLMQLTAGNSDSAALAWRNASGEPSRFWYAVAVRGTDRARSDSLLRAIARKPGFSFYRAAARDTLGEFAWPGQVAADSAPSGAAGRALEAVRALAGAGLAEDAGHLLARLFAGDQRLAGAEGPLSPHEWLACARTAYALGQVALGTRIAERAFSDAANDSVQWSIVPWAYPPAFAPEVVAAETLGVERALTWGLIRQESRFDPRARSSSDALGLAQLKLSTAGDVARWLREPAPTESVLFTPGVSVRYGARYFAQMLARFGGSPPVALVAYNAGPNAMRADWRELLARGGDALFCELGTNADSQDYARRITGFRQAYRVFAPREAGQVW